MSPSEPDRAWRISPDGRLAGPPPNLRYSTGAGQTGMSRWAWAAADLRRKPKGKRDPTARSSRRNSPRFAGVKDHYRRERPEGSRRVRMWTVPDCAPSSLRERAAHTSIPLAVIVDSGLACGSRSVGVAANSNQSA